MLIDKNIIDNLRNDAGEDIVKIAEDYQKQHKIEIIDYKYKNQWNFEVKAIVKDNQKYNTYVYIENGEVQDITCNCEEYYKQYGICKHTLATILEFMNYKKEVSKIDTKLLEKSETSISSKYDKYRWFKQIVNTFYHEEIEGIEEEENELKEQGTIKLEPEIFYDKFTGDMKVEFRIGNKKMYKIKSLSDFYIKMLDKELYKYGQKLQFVHTAESFEQESLPLLNFVMKYAEIIKYANSNSNSNYRFYGNALSENSIILSNSGIDDFFDILKGKSVELEKEQDIKQIKFTEEQPDIKFKLVKQDENNYELIPNTDIYKLSILKGRKYKYLLDENKLYRCDKKFEKANLKLLEIFRQNYMTEVKLGKEELSQLFSVIIPKVKSAIKIENISEEEIEKYKPQILITKVYLDFDAKDNLIADVKFCYGEEEFNPLDEKQKIEIPRNMIKETKALNIFRKTGFMLDVKNLRFILPDDDKIYKFLTQDINYYMQNFEILATEDFKKKQIKQPKMGSIGVKIENNLLSIDLNNLDIDVQELQKIMERYNLKKKYYRLKDGSFLELEDNKEVEFLDKLVTGMDLEYKDLEDGELQLPMYRSLYLEELLKKNKGNQVIKNNEYKNIVSELEKDNINEDVEVPKVLNNTLRYYQKIGFKWLKTLDKYRFGGILADDMGLGKTIQMLSIIMDYVQNTPKTERRASIVVSPSSLTLNWQNEAAKFTNNLRTLVINGTLAERKDKIKNIKDYDLVITSYDLLKRDIDLYKENKYQFRYIIADEAQYLKNSNTQNAKAIKKILADTRYALTGTPIENSLAELWSIFDYIMPGYLFSYKKFKSLYEIPIVKDSDMKAMEKLKMLIEPFVLRRTKNEVLTELPEKTVTILNSEMEEEQKNIYISYLAQAREEVAQEIKVNGIEKSHIKILALLTRLRQICCHPSLFIKDYNLGSSKLNQCLEIIEDAVKSEHKILLFSGYTSMFPIIEEQLQQLNIKYLKLTGATKVDERIEMVDEFNENPNIKVFLISLKAGGTGLNLTGADMVIHYDPWWNISTENQATDRAYRIGQKNNVQVYKLITKDSIEEKMYELQQKKAELIDNMLSTKTSFINKLSKEDIMNLFS